MKVLLDSNILLSLLDDRLCGNGAVEALTRRGGNLFITAQSLAEYYAGATRPALAGLQDAKPGKGLPPTSDLKQIAAFRLQFSFLTDSPDVLDCWLSLLGTHQVIGRQTHDCRLAAYCKAHDIPYILTYDKKDFNRFENLTVLHPDTIANKGIC